MNMPILTQFGNSEQKTMSSRVIADLTEKRHDHVKRDVENMLGQLGLDIPKFGGIYFDAQNRQQTEYLLDEELTMTLVTGYNIVLRNRVIKRWKDLELQASQPSYMIADPIERAKKWIEEEKQKQIAIQELSIAAPKAQALDVLSNSHGTETVDNCAHAMGIQPRKTLRPWMEGNGWIYKDKDDQWRAKSDRIMAGHLIEASRVITDTSGKPHHKVTVYVTPRGKALLTTRLIQAGIIKGDVA